MTTCCRKHGVPFAFEPYEANTPFYMAGIYGLRYCPECEAEREAEREAEAAKERRRQLVRGIPPHYHDADLRQFDAAHIAPVLKWLENPSGFIYVTGECGRGKTHLACAAKKKLNAAGRRSSMVFSMDMFLELHKSFNRNSTAAEDEIINRYAPDYDSGVVIFDDVGAQKVSDYTVDTWYKIIDKRYRYNSPTFITTNLNPKELGESLSDRTASRILSGVRFELKGDDRRIIKNPHWTAKYD